MPVSVRLEIVSVLVQDRCTVCAKCTIASEIVLEAPDGTIGLEIVLDAPDGTPRWQDSNGSSSRLVWK
jgi:hypothetical protein